MTEGTPADSKKFFAPEVIQTSEMDCGPAALKAILDGFGIPVNYGRLREACQTDVDGTSIDTLEDLAVQLGLEAEQVMLPVDYLLLPEAQALPAIVVVVLPNGMTHFLVVWGRIGNFLQVMDPATGRRWPGWKKFLNEVYIHNFPVSAQAWREWAGTEGLLAPLRRRLLNLDIDQSMINWLVEEAVQDPGWRALATLDAAARMVDAIVRSGGLEPGKEAGRVLERFFSLNLSRSKPPAIEYTDGLPIASGPIIPEVYWSVSPIEAGEESSEPERLMLRGAVLIRILGRRFLESGEEVPTDEMKSLRAALPPDLQMALEEPAYHPEREVWNSLRQDGLLTPAILTLAIALATVSVIIEALLFQGVIKIGSLLTSVWQRMAAFGILLAFVIVPLLLEYPISSTVLRMGRRLEARLRIALLEKIPRLGDRYFHSRLTSDMTQRAHDLRSLRNLPSLGFSLLRTAFQLILTTIGVIWLDPINAPLAILGTIFFFGLTFLTRPILEEQDLRLRTQTGALSRFYLDALLGLVPAKTHGAERSMRRQHEVQLLDWIHSGREYYNLTNYVRSIGALLYSGFAILIVMNYISRGGQPGEILLLFYWTLSLPTLGQSLAFLIQQYPMQRNRVLRLLEPLSAPDEETAWALADENRPVLQKSPDSLQPAGIQMEAVHLRIGGHTILEEIDLEIQPGEHVAVVGPSGAGKSSLVGLMLGWHRPVSGQIRIDGTILDGKGLQTLRQETAWVDPAVRLWNRSMYENLRYGSENAEVSALGSVMGEANLLDVVERLPEGMKTVLGEGGGLVSGGEGQRVRLGRAFLRKDARLVILDEPFRGLDRAQRRQLLQQARQHWQASTLICITHDVSETLGFPRVVVIEDGRIVEDGEPDKLSQQIGTRYQALLEAEEAVREGLWASGEWRRYNLAGGQLSADGS
jgi:ATP-binding cassette subfamily B protein